MTRHDLRFLPRVLSAPILVAPLGGAAAYAGHHMADLPDLLARAGVVAAASVPIAYALFRPVARLFDSGAGAHVPVERLQQLPLYAGISMFGVTAVPVMRMTLKAALRLIRTAV